MFKSREFKVENGVRMNQQTAAQTQSAPNPLRPPEVTIRYDVKMLTALSRKVVLKNLIIFSAGGVLAILFGALIYSFVDDRFLRALGLILIILGSSLILIYGMLFFLLPVLSKKSPAIKWQTVSHLYFGEKITGSEESAVSAVKEIAYEWVAIIKAGEDKNYFFLFLTKQTAVVVPKAELVNCTEEEFRALLKQKLGARYKGK